MGKQLVSGHMVFQLQSTFELIMEHVLEAYCIMVDTAGLHMFEVHPINVPMQKMYYENLMKNLTKHVKVVQLDLPNTAKELRATHKYVGKLLTIHTRHSSLLFNTFLW